MMRGHFSGVFGFSLILSLCSSAGGFIFDGDDIAVGEVTPVNPKAVLNQTLELNCTVFESSGLNASLLGWDIHGSWASPDTVSIYGEKTLMFQKKITNVEEAGTYSCRRTDEKDYGKSMVKSISLITEYEAVRNVTNFSCIVNEEKREFHCQWELGLYKRPSSLNVSVIMSPDNGSTVTLCPKKFKFQQNCTWTEQDVGNAAIFSMSKIVVLTVNNMDFNETKSFRKEFKTETMTKPLPTEYVNASSLDSCGCANVSWGTIPGGVKTFSQVILMSQWNSVPLVHNVDVNKSLIVCNLIPATTYIVTVIIKPLGGLYYSEEVKKVFDTCERVPSLAPPLQSSGFSSGDCTMGYRSITVYWEKIPRRFQNGPLKEYRVVLGDGDWKIVAPNVTSATINIPCGGRNITVQGCNQLGCSPDSTIYIPAYTETFNIAPKNSLVEAWSPLNCDSGASDNAYIKMYQIFYCQMNTQGSCKGREYSVSVLADSTTQYTLRDLEADTEYGVWVQAMSLTKEGRRSKMVTGRPTNNDLPGGSIAGIAIGGIFVLILVNAGFVFVCRLVRRKLGLDEKFEIENIQVRPYENLPTGSNLYNNLTVPADRSSSPLITLIGMSSNGDIRHNGVNHSYEEILPVGSTVDLDEEDGCGEPKDSKPDLKSSMVTLPITDVPRQISKDSGHGSLSPTSTHGPPEESDTKERILRDIVLDLPPDYAKATSVTTQCVHGYEKGSFDTEDSFPPDSRGTYKDSLCSSSQSGGIPVEDGYKSQADILQDNNDKQQIEESSKKCPVNNELGRNEVEQTSGYVMYSSNDIEITAGSQITNVQPRNTIPTYDKTQTTTGHQPHNVQSTETTMENQINNVQAETTTPTCNITQTNQAHQPYNVQFKNTVPNITKTISTNQSNSAKNQCSKLQRSPVDQLNNDQSNGGIEIKQETDMCQTDKKISSQGYHPNRTLDTERRTTEMGSSPQLLTAESEQITNYLPHNTNFAELAASHNDKENSLIFNCAAGNANDLSVMNFDYVPNATSDPLPNGKTSHLSDGTSDKVPKDTKNFSGMNYVPTYVPDDTADNISSVTKHVPCSPAGHVSNGAAEYVPNGTTDYVLSDATGYVPNGATDYVPNGTTDYVSNGATDYVSNGTSD
ncbi:uncharacterized protein LOC134236513 [Saccostrea cucullata]|uniref:uncharacterized protein LOC134236513 n=1 Tax=Saccostrea cuccullata TaxID=36930 RepID=UPI002ECFFD4F